MAGRQQKWSLIVLTTGMLPSIMTKERLIIPFAPCTIPFAPCTMFFVAFAFPQ